MEKIITSLPVEKAQNAEMLGGKFPGEYLTWDKLRGQNLVINSDLQVQDHYTLTENDNQFGYIGTAWLCNRSETGVTAGKVSFRKTQQSAEKFAICATDDIGVPTNSEGAWIRHGIEIDGICQHYLYDDKDITVSFRASRGSGDKDPGADTKVMAAVTLYDDITTNIETVPEGGSVIVSDLPETSLDGEPGKLASFTFHVPPNFFRLKTGKIRLYFHAVCSTQQAVARGYGASEAFGMNAGEVYFGQPLVEIGSTPSVYKPRTLQEEQVLCSRYFETSRANAYPSWNWAPYVICAGVVHGGEYRFKYLKRAVPNVAVYSATNELNTIGVAVQGAGSVAYPSATPQHITSEAFDFAGYVEPVFGTTSGQIAIQWDADAENT